MVFDPTIQEQNSDMDPNRYIWTLEKSRTIFTNYYLKLSTGLLEKQLNSNVNRNRGQLLWLQVSSSLSCNPNQYWTRWYPNYDYHIYWWLDNWGRVFIKQKGAHQHLPVDFYCKCFPYMENKYSLFEKQIWTFYKECRTWYSVPANHSMVFRAAPTMTD